MLRSKLVYWFWSLIILKVFNVFSLLSPPKKREWQLKNVLCNVWLNFSNMIFEKKISNSKYRLTIYFHLFPTIYLWTWIPLTQETYEKVWLKCALWFLRRGNQYIFTILLLSSFSKKHSSSLKQTSRSWWKYENLKWLHTTDKFQFEKLSWA